MNKAGVIEICSGYGLAPVKKLGQNFLIDDNTITKIINALELAENDSVLEIGPGLGALTEILVREVSSVVAVEIDSGISGYLSDKFRDNDNFTLIHSDFLKTPALQGITKAVSNLPYYCASEILFRLIEQYSLDFIGVMVQKEMAERMAAKPGSRSYGALTLGLGFYYNIKIALNISRRAFFPVPDVDSSFVILRRKDLLLLETKEERDLFHLLVKSAFWGRRKTILKALSDSPHMEYSRNSIESALNRAGIDISLRGEALGIEDFAGLASALYENGQS